MSQRNSTRVLYCVTTITTLFAFSELHSELAWGQGPIAYWPGEGNANDAAGVNSGTLHGGVTFGSGIIGQAFRFNGSSYAQAPTIGLPVGSQDRTLALWFKIDAFNSGESFLGGYGSFGTSSAAYELGVLPSQSPFFSQWGDAHIASTTVQPSEWHHLAVANVGNLATLYLDGVSVGSTSFLAINTSAETNFYLGRIPGPFGNFRQLVGLVDEVRVYNRALSSSEIEALATVPEASMSMLAVAGAAILINACRMPRKDANRAG